MTSALGVLLVAAFLLAAPVLRAQTLSPYAGIESNVQWLFFEKNAVPDFARAGNEISGVATVDLGLLVTAFPVTAEAALRYHPDDENASIKVATASYFGEGWSASLGKSEVAWGLGTFFQPLFFLDFLYDEYSPEAVFEQPGRARIWNLQAGLNGESGTITVRSGLDQDAVEQAQRPAWYFVQALGKWYTESAEADLSLAYLERDREGTLRGGGEMKYAFTDWVSGKLAAELSAPAGSTDPGSRLLGGVELMIVPERLYMDLESWYKEDDWFCGITINLLPPLQMTASATAAYDITHRGVLATLTVEWIPDPSIRWAVKGTMLQGDKDSVYGSRDVSSILETSVRLSFR